MKTLGTKFCKCIKSVRKTVKLRPGKAKTAKSREKAKEAAAIAICTKSVLQTRGKTLKRFSCKKKTQLLTQKPLPVRV